MPIPAPSYALGPRSPRWDRLALDETLRRALLEQLEPPGASRGPRRKRFWSDAKAPKTGILHPAAEFKFADGRGMTHGAPRFSVMTPNRQLAHPTPVTVRATTSQN